jgi:hypothetical protein
MRSDHRRKNRTEQEKKKAGCQTNPRGSACPRSGLAPALYEDAQGKAQAQMVGLLVAKSARDSFACCPYCY